MIKLQFKLPQALDTNISGIIQPIFLPALEIDRPNKKLELSHTVYIFSLDAQALYRYSIT